MLFCCCSVSVMLHYAKDLAFVYILFVSLFVSRGLFLLFCCLIFVMLLYAKDLAFVYILFLSLFAVGCSWLFCWCLILQPPPPPHLFASHITGIVELHLLFHSPDGKGVLWHPCWPTQAHREAIWWTCQRHQAALPTLHQRLARRFQLQVLDGFHLHLLRLRLSMHRLRRFARSALANQRNS